MTDATDQKAGYGRPPVAHQFKKGRSGNPNGRPRKRKLERAYLTRQLRSDIIEIMEEEVTIRTAKGTRREPAGRAMLRMLQGQAFAGDRINARYLWKLYCEAIAEHERNLPNAVQLRILRHIERRFGDAAPGDYERDLNDVRKWTREV